MPEQYVESIIMRQDNRPETLTPMLEDSDCDKIFKLKANVKLVQIIKSVQNAVHNRHDYVFKIVDIKDLKEGEY